MELDNKAKKELLKEFARNTLDTELAEIVLAGLEKMPDDQAGAHYDALKKIEPVVDEILKHRGLTL